MMDASEEKRHFPRLTRDVRITVKKLLPGGHEWPAETRELGLGGLSFIHPGSLGVGTPLELQIPVGETVVTVQARVIYEHAERNGVEIGAEYTASSMGDLELLQRLFGPLATAFP